MTDVVKQAKQGLEFEDREAWGRTDDYDIILSATDWSDPWAHPEYELEAVAYTRSDHSPASKIYQEEYKTVDALIAAFERLVDEHDLNEDETPPWEEKTEESAPQSFVGRLLGVDSE